MRGTWVVGKWCQTPIFIWIAAEGFTQGHFAEGSTTEKSGTAPWFAGPAKLIVPLECSRRAGQGKCLPQPKVELLLQKNRQRNQPPPDHEARTADRRNLTDACRDGPDFFQVDAAGKNDDAEYEQAARNIQ
jgi:hypothetical protein